MSARHRFRDDLSVKFRDTVQAFDGQRYWVITATKEGVTGTGMAPYARIVSGEPGTFSEATNKACEDLERRLGGG